MGGRSGAALGRLRRYLTAVFAVVALFCLLVMGGVVLVIEQHAAARAQDQNLRGMAARITALVYGEENPTTGRLETRVDGLEDDGLLNHRQYVFFQVAANGRLQLLYRRNEAPTPQLEPAARGALTDEADRGTYDDVQVGDTTYRVCAMPWYDEQGIAGAAVIMAPRPPLIDLSVLVPVTLVGVPLFGILTWTFWRLAGRSTQPVSEVLAERERFLANTAHELRAPLARLRTEAEAARRASPPDDPTAPTLRRLVKVADAAGRVVANLILSSRIQHDEMPVRRDLVRLDEIAGDVERVVDDLVLDVTEPVPVVGDRPLLRHAIEALVDNALRHGVAGNELAVVTVSAFHRDGHPVLRVSDEGPGFPQDVEVMGRYVTGGGSGTGLGLTLVDWIVARHDATMTLRNGTDDASGAVVEIVFPRVPDPAAQADHVPVAESG